MAYDPRYGDQVLDEAALINQYGDQEQDNLKWQLDPREVLDDLERQLRGIEYIDGKGLVRFRRPLVNKMGIGMIKVCLRAHLSPSNVLSVIKRENAYDLTKDCLLELNNLIFQDGDIRWGLRDEDWPFVIMIIGTQVFLFLTRAIDGGERARLTRTFQYQDGYKPKSRISSLFGGRGKIDGEDVYQNG